MTEFEFKPIRRVVTGHAPNNRSKILWDGNTTNIVSQSEKVTSASLWNTLDTAASPSADADSCDLGAHNIGFAPPCGGSRFVIVDFKPGCPVWMHRTDTLDYAIVLAGEINLITDECTVELKAGDVIVQRSTRHGWENRGDAIARVAFVMMGTKPLRIEDGLVEPLPPDFGKV